MHALGCSREIPCWLPARSCWWPESVSLHIPSQPLCTPGCSREFLLQHPPFLLMRRVRPFTHSPASDTCSRLLWGVASAAPGCRFMHPPCWLGNFLVLLMGAGLAAMGSQGGLSDLLQAHLDMGVLSSLPRPRLRLVCAQILLSATLKCAKGT